MSWLTFWTSKSSTKEPPPTTTPPKLLPPFLDGTTISLRSVRKMSGLFDTAEVDNKLLRNKTSDGNDYTELDFGDNSTLTSAPGAALADLFEDLPAMLPAADDDYLDSFVDLTNFINQGSEVIPTETTGDNNTVVVEMNDEAKVPEVTVHVTVGKGGKRKREEEFSTISILDLEQTAATTSTSDHDYMSKKRKVVSQVAEVSSRQAPTPPASTSGKKYRERRDKNNMASKRSREIRKQKYQDMEYEAERLIVENDKMKEKIVELEKLAKEMKAMLIMKMTDNVKAK